MILKHFIAGELENNMYLLLDEISKQGVLIDATENLAEIAEEAKGYDIEYILLTHGHFDHILGLNDLKNTLHAKAVINANDISLVEKMNEYTYLFGVNDGTVPVFDMYVKDGDEVKCGNLTFNVIETPGHTEGGVCYLIDNMLFSGDTLFRGSVGRTDLFGGNFKKLQESITKKLFRLDDNITVYPGHGPETTIGYEKIYNEIL